MRCRYSTNSVLTLQLEEMVFGRYDFTSRMCRVSRMWALKQAFPSVFSIPTRSSSWITFSSFSTCQICFRLRASRSPAGSFCPRRLRLCSSTLWALKRLEELWYICALTCSMEKLSCLAQEGGFSRRALPCRILVRWSLRESRRRFGARSLHAWKMASLNSSKPMLCCAFSELPSTAEDTRWVRKLPILRSRSVDLESAEFSSASRKSLQKSSLCSFSRGTSTRTQVRERQRAFWRLGVSARISSSPKQLPLPTISVVMGRKLSQQLRRISLLMASSSLGGWLCGTRDSNSTSPSATRQRAWGGASIWQTRSPLLQRLTWKEGVQYLLMLSRRRKSGKAFANASRSSVVITQLRSTSCSSSSPCSTTSISAFSLTSTALCRGSLPNSAPMPRSASTDATSSYFFPARPSLSLAEVSRRGSAGRARWQTAMRPLRRKQLFLLESNCLSMTCFSRTCSHRMATLLKAGSKRIRSRFSMCRSKRNLSSLLYELFLRKFSILNSLPISNCTEVERVCSWTVLGSFCWRCDCLRAMISVMVRFFISACIQNYYRLYPSMLIEPMHNQLDLPEQGVLPGQDPKSMCLEVSSAPSIHCCTLRMREYCESVGMRQEGLLQQALERQQWFTHTGPQTPFWFLLLISKSTCSVLCRYDSMRSMEVLLQSSSEAPLRQRMPRMLQRLQESQSDWGAKSGVEMKGWMYCANMHFQSSLGQSWLHSAIGVPTSSFDSFIMFWNQMRQEFTWVIEFTSSTNTPESGIDQNCVSLASLEARQLVQWKVASPPADSPVRTRCVTLLVKILLLLLMESNCARVMSCPRKKSCAPLQRSGSERVPWWPEPSQYLRKTRVQPLKQLSAWSERMPLPKVWVGLQPVELPRSVLLRWQQFSVVELRSLSPHHPPPSMKISTFWGSPCQMQYAPCEPSRHFALASSNITFWQTSEAEARTRTAAIRIGLIMIYLLTQIIAAGKVIIL